MVASSKGSKGFVVLPFYGTLWKMIKMMFKAFKAMTVPQGVVKEVNDLMSPACSLGINTKLQKVLAILQECGLLYVNTACPSDFLCHLETEGAP